MTTPTWYINNLDIAFAWIVINVYDSYLNVTFGNVYKILPFNVPTCGPTFEPTYCPAVGQHVY